jgi:hypothetical protein
LFFMNRSGVLTFAPYLLAGLRLGFINHALLTATAIRTRAVCWSAGWPTWWTRPWNSRRRISPPCRRCCRPAA